jgi:hypothetical protein
VRQHLIIILNWVRIMRMKVLVSGPIVAASIL